MAECRNVKSCEASFRKTTQWLSIWYTGEFNLVDTWNHSGWLESQRVIQPVICRINPSGDGDEIFRDNQVNTMVADVLAPCVARSSAAMVLTVIYTGPCLHDLRHLKVKRLQTNANTFLFPPKIQHTKGYHISIPSNMLSVLLQEQGRNGYRNLHLYKSTGSLRNITSASCLQWITFSKLPIWNRSWILKIKTKTPAQICKLINPLRDKFFRESINIYSYFVSYLHIDTTPVIEILLQIRQEPSYSTESISWLLMFWRRKEPGHEQLWYWPT